MFLCDYKIGLLSAIYFQGLPILVSASDRSFESRHIGEICTKFEKPRGSQGEYRSWYVSSGTKHHPGYYRGISPHRYRIFIWCQEAGDHVHFCMLRSDRQLCCIHDFLPGLFVAYTRGNWLLQVEIQIFVISIYFFTLYFSATFLSSLYFLRILSCVHIVQYIQKFGCLIKYDTNCIYILLSTQLLI